MAPTARADQYVDGLGFDTCEAPSSASMAALKLSYDYVGIYIGGVTRYCGQPYLNAGWVRTERNAGWDFLVLWAGYQDPCLQGSYNTFSISNPTAFKQGEQSAINAVSVAAPLGFGATGVITLDLEAYTSGQYVYLYGLSNCEYAARGYVSGWTYELHALGYMSEVYGSSSGSDLVDFVNASHVPYQIFFAEYDGQANVSSAYIPDYYWYYNQRVKQYEGNVPNPFVPIGLIDLDCADAVMSGDTYYLDIC